MQRKKMNGYRGHLAGGRDDKLRERKWRMRVGAGAFFLTT